MEDHRLKLYRLQPRSGFKYGAQAYDVYTYEIDDKGGSSNPHLVASFVAHRPAQDYVNHMNGLQQYYSQQEEK
jgi:hypothetical protein